MTSYVVAAVAEVPPGGKKLVTVAGRPVALFNVGGEFFALNNRCPHRGGSLIDGVRTALIRSAEPGVYERSRLGEVVKCPWHAWEFDIRTGRSFCDPTRVRTKSYEVAIAPGTRAAELLRAETFPVRVEDDYVVVEA